MEAPIVGGIIAGSCTLTGAVVNRLSANRTHQSIPEGRRAALAGRWEGTSKQEVGPSGEPMVYNITADLKATRKVVTGTAYAHGTAGEIKDELGIELSGGFVHEQFLELHWKNKAAHTIQFGYALLQLSADGCNLRGMFIGYGRLTENIVASSIHMKKTLPTA